MRRWGNILLHAGFFFLCFAQIPLLVGQAVLESPFFGLLMLAVLLPLALVLALIPGKIGGKARKDVPVERTSRGNDPDPDRHLRSAALPLPERRAFPLRATVSFLTVLAIVAVFLILPLPILSHLAWYMRLLLGVVYGGILLTATYCLSGTRVDEAHLALIGMILYAVSGIVIYFADLQIMNQMLLLFGGAFLVAAGLTLNNRSLRVGSVTEEGKRPSAMLRRRNRVILLVFGVILAIVACFDQIRYWTVRAARAILAFIWAIIDFLTSLAFPDSTGGSGDGGSPDSMGGLPGGEPAAFWQYMEYVAYVIVIAIVIVLLYFMLRKILRNLIKFYHILEARFKLLAGGLGEDYQDEQESLLNWGEVQKDMGAALRKRLNRLFAREKKWEQMNASEQVRFVVRGLYRRVRGVSLSTLTIREAISHLPVGSADPEQVAKLYDKARYSNEIPSPEEAERLRKETAK